MLRAEGEFQPGVARSLFDVIFFYCMASPVQPCTAGY